MTKSIRLTYTALVALCALAVCLSAVGCGSSKVTPENIAKVKSGMSEKEITDILGAATEEKDVSPLGKTKVWKNGNTGVAVMFADGKAMMVLPVKAGG